MKLFKVTGFQVWYVVARDKRDIRPLLFRFETNFCKDGIRVLDDIRDVTIVTLGEPSGECNLTPGVISVDRLEEGGTNE